MSFSICGRILTRSFLRKGRDVCRAEMDSSRLERTYSLFDLLCVGVGGTVGSGVFVLTGLIAREHSGAGVVISWLIAGFGCCFSAMSYAELSCRIPSAGSSYAYVYVALGEFPAVVAAWCLSLEYGISGSAVARSWGDKVNAYIASLYAAQIESVSGTDITKQLHTFWNPFSPGYGVNVFAGLLQVAVVLILLAGVDIGKFAVNTFTIVKIILVLFMIVTGLALFQPSNLSSASAWAPKGMSGILRGATSSFFGFVGYDEVCCLAAEAKDPNRVLPLAVFGTITIVTVFYCLASLALVGMQDYRLINVDSGFSEALKSRGWPWAQHVVAIGEIATLPLVVLVSFLAQPRLQYAMATDGLLPQVFSDVDKKGNFVKGIIISGLICVLIALFVPFKYLDDMISAGVLVSFNLTNASLIIIRRCDSSNPLPCTLALILFNVLSILFHILLVNISFTGTGTFILHSFEILSISTLVILLLINAIYIHVRCPENEDLEAINQFRVPGLPFVPLFGIFVNYLLLAQLSVTGIMMIFGYFGLAGIFYFGYGIHHSKGNNTGWRETLNDASPDELNRKYGNMNMIEGIVSVNGGGEKQIEYTFQSSFRESLHDDSDISNGYTNGNNNINNHNNNNHNNNNNNSSNRKILKTEKSNTSIMIDTGNGNGNGSGNGLTASHAGKRKVCPGTYALLGNSNDHDDDARKDSEIQNVTTHLRKVF